MARRKIREYDAKKLLVEELSKHGFSLRWKGVLVNPETDLLSLPQRYPWLLTTSLVVKPDQLFGKRGKWGLVGVDLNFEQAQEFIMHHQKEITIGKAADRLTHFLIEPYLRHTQEYYLSIISEREGNTINFSAAGGVDVEENWEKVKTVFVPIVSPVENDKIMELLAAINDRRETLAQFIIAAINLYRELDFTYLEFNPFTIDEQGTIHLLDAVAQMDDSAAFLHRAEWKGLSFPKSFGQKSFPEEEFIAALDKESGASLKLTILNQKGRIWNILSGGGASIIYLDTIAGLGKQEEIANYGEYSGNPTTEESYQYAKTILDLMTREVHPQGKILIIGGAIANFTDVEKTFTGIVKALREYQEKLRGGGISIFVRRGGPNYERGLRLMEEAGKELNIPMLVYGPDRPMVEMVGKAVERI